MRKDEKHNDPFQDTKDQERSDIESYGKKDRVHDVESQMKHHWQQETLLAVIQEPGDVEREWYHKQEVQSQIPDAELIERVQQKPERDMPHPPKEAENDA